MTIGKEDKSIEETLDKILELVTPPVLFPHHAQMGIRPFVPGIMYISYVQMPTAVGDQLRVEIKAVGEYDFEMRFLSDSGLGSKTIKLTLAD